MTRINIIDPFELSDQHLMAEYREITMVPAALRRSLRTRSVPDILKGIPTRFTLNAGHVTFFYDKLSYLKERYQRLQLELIDRGVEIDLDREFDIADLPQIFHGSYQPDEAAAAVIRRRIAEKIAMKPQWYRWTRGSHGAN